jgi:hypothetical protein
MKRTMDLQEDLVRGMKFRAVRGGRKQRVAEEIFRRGLAVPVNPAESGTRRRIDLPLIPAPPGAEPFELSGKRLLECEAQATESL